MPDFGDVATGAVGAAGGAPAALGLVASMYPYSRGAGLPFIAGGALPAGAAAAATSDSGHQLAEGLGASLGQPVGALAGGTGGALLAGEIIRRLGLDRGSGGMALPVGLTTLLGGSMLGGGLGAVAGKHLGGGLAGLFDGGEKQAAIDPAYAQYMQEAQQMVQARAAGGAAAARQFGINDRPMRVAPPGLTPAMQAFGRAPNTALPRPAPRPAMGLLQRLFRG